MLSLGSSGAPDSFWKKFISVNQEVRGGKPCISGTRMAVVDVLSYFATGYTMEQFLDEFQHITKDQVLACFSYAAENLY